VAGVLRVEDFYQPANATIFAVVLDLYARGEPVDPVTVVATLTQDGTLGKLPGGALYLHTLMSTVPTAANAGYYAQVVADAATRRRLIAAGTRIVQFGYAADGSSATDALGLAETELYGIGRTTGEDYHVIGDVLPDVVDEIEASEKHGTVAGAIQTGFRDLDALTHGLHPGQLVIVAGRPALGKSTLALDIMRSASIAHGFPAVLFSLEMSRSEIVTRVLAAEGKIDLSRLRSGKMGSADWGRVAGVTGRLVDAPLFIDDSANLTMTDIRAKARRLRQQHDLRLIVVDYLQLMSTPGRHESRQQEVSDLSRSLKLLAKELNVPVIAVSQLNRGPEGRQDKRPVLSDLRESGAIEQDADVVILLSREDAYEKESTRAGEADFIVAKHRNGPTATVTVAFQGHFSRFVDMANEWAG
jgi:replicative DNA helicase